MIKINVNQLEVKTLDQFNEIYNGVELIKESGVYKIEVGCRGENELVGKVELDGEGNFEILSDQEEKKRLLEAAKLEVDDLEELADYYNYLDEFVGGYWFDGIYGMSLAEEFSHDYVRVEVK